MTRLFHLFRVGMASLCLLAAGSACAAGRRRDRGRKQQPHDADRRDQRDPYDEAWRRRAAPFVPAELR